MNRWQTGVAIYGKVKLNGVYNGVDLVYYGNGRQLEYDFIVAPGADPNTIRLNFSGTDNARLDAAGDLLLHTQDGELRLQKPVVYQTVGGERKNVDGRFVLHKLPLPQGEGRGEGKHISQQIGFQVAAYDAGLPLVIDPVLVYSSYLGGSGWDLATDIAVDSAGNAYVTGYTNSADYTTVNAKYSQLQGNDDAFVTKLSADGQQIIYSTYLGGSNDDEGNDIAIDIIGNAYLTGSTSSVDFPTVNAKYPQLRGSTDAFVTKLSADGQTIVYSTYLGGSNYDGSASIAVDNIGNTCVTGGTYSADFPIVNAVYPQYGGNWDAFVAKLSADGQKVIYSTYLGGSELESSSSIAIDSIGNAYVTGRTWSTNFPTNNAKYPHFNVGYQDDAFITKISEDGQRVIYSTYLGGSGQDEGTSIAVDNIGNIYVIGRTESADFPTVNARYPQFRSNSDAFVIKLTTSGQTVVYSTYLGGSEFEGGGDIAVDSTGNAYVTGGTTSADFPIVNAKYPQLRGYTDAFVSKLSANGQIVIYSTYLGGSGQDGGIAISVDNAGNAYVIGNTDSSDFPSSVTDPKIVSYDSSYSSGMNVFIAKFGTSYLEITPNNQDFSLTPPNTITDRTFTLKNTANRTLTGTLTNHQTFYHSLRRIIHIGRRRKPSHHSPFRAHSKRLF